jgi:hypothetical protein
MLIISVPTVYPETANRSLESIDALFSTNRPFNWDMERAYREYGDVLRNEEKSDVFVLDNVTEGGKGEELVSGERV